MTHSKYKRLLAGLLSVVMTCSMFAPAVNAAGVTPDQPVYSEANRFAFPTEVGKVATLEAELLNLKNNTENDAEWPLQVKEGTWASNGKYVDALNSNDAAELYYNAEKAGTYYARVIYRSGAVQNSIAWNEANNQIGSGDVTAGASSTEKTHTAVFNINVTTPGEGVLTFRGGDSSAPQIDKFEIFLPSESQEFEYEKIPNDLIHGINASSEETKETNSYGDGPAAWAFDGNMNKPWHTRYTATGTHWIEWTLPEATVVGRIDYFSKGAGSNGAWKKFYVQYCEDDTDNWKTLVNENTDAYDGGNRQITFSPTMVKKLRVTITEGQGGFASAKEIVTYRYVPTETVKSINSISTDSYHNGSGAELAFDSQKNTHWHTAWDGNHKKCPHYIQWNVGTATLVGQIEYFRRQDDNINGNWQTITILGKNGENGIWSPLLENQGVEKKTCGPNNNVGSIIKFPPQMVTDLRVIIEASYGDRDAENTVDHFATAAEIVTYKYIDTTPVQENITLTVGQSQTVPFTGTMDNVTVDPTGAVKAEISTVAAEQNVGYKNISQTQTLNLTGLKPGTATVTAGGITYNVNVLPFNLSGVSMVLGNSLALRFGIDKTLLPENTSNLTAKITRTYAANPHKNPSADWSQTEEVTVPFNEWRGQAADEPMYLIDYDKIAAKEMMDEVTVQIFDGDTAISNERTSSVNQYVLDLLAGPDQNNTYLRTVAVDMLTYGAEAQKFFKYNDQNLATQGLSEDQKAWGTPLSASALAVANDTYSGTSLTLESNILMNVYFKMADQNVKPDHATVSYQHHHGGGQVTNPLADIKTYTKNPDMYSVTVDGLVVADYQQPVTVTVFNASDEKIAEVTGKTMEQYLIAASAQYSGKPIYPALKNFSKSSFDYFGSLQNSQNNNGGN